MAEEVWVTGYGLLCHAGERPEDWWRHLDDGDPTRSVDRETCAPFPIYPVPEYDLASQVPRPGDQRAMGPMMHYGVYAAGLALEAAGIKGDEDLLQRMHTLAACGGGERDWEVDADLIKAMSEGPVGQETINAHLADGLRPTLFLAQLPNLFAGNISIVHGVSGASRTFMGEEEAGIDTARVAFERIRSGQGQLFLVGGAFNAARPDLHYMYHAGGILLAEAPGNLWQRPESGMAMGSAGAFLVVEAASHATARGARPLARIAHVSCDRCGRAPGASTAGALRQWSGIAAEAAAEVLPVLSGACGIGSITGEEHDFLDEIIRQGQPLAVRGTAMALGHTIEASFLVNLALAVSCLQRGALFAPLSPEEPIEAGMDSTPLRQVLVTGFGHRRGEGMALLEAIDG